MGESLNDPELDAMVDALPDEWAVEPLPSELMRRVRAALDAYRAEQPYIPMSPRVERMQREADTSAGYAEGFKDGWEQGREQMVDHPPSGRRIIAESNFAIRRDGTSHGWSFDPEHGGKEWDTRDPAVEIDEQRTLVAGAYAEGWGNGYTLGRKVARASRVQVGWWDGSEVKGLRVTEFGINPGARGWLPVWIDGPDAGPEQ